MRGMPWDIVLIFLVLGVVVPWRGRVRLKQLLAKPRVESSERLALYASTITFQWVATAIAGWRAWAHGFSYAQLGLTSGDPMSIGALAIGGTLVIVALQWLNLRRIGRSNSPLRAPLQALAQRILPQSSRELALFCVLAVTAGICEEFLYRGFAMAALGRSGLPSAAVVVTSAVMFGLAHLYQGRGGFVGTLILGLLFGFSRLSLGTLIPVTAWHTGVDLVAGIAGPRYLVRAEKDAQFTVAK
jgi:CAAX protease family protein